MLHSGQSLGSFLKFVPFPGHLSAFLALIGHNTCLSPPGWHVFMFHNSYISLLVFPQAEELQPVIKLCFDFSSISVKIIGLCWDVPAFS